MRELAYDSMVLQSQKDKDKAEQEERKKASFKKFAKFMEEQEKVIIWIISFKLN